MNCIRILPQTNDSNQKFARMAQQNKQNKQTNKNKYRCCSTVPYARIQHGCSQPDPPLMRLRLIKCACYRLAWVHDRMRMRKDATILVFRFNQKENINNNNNNGSVV
mmetsp:Transcript_15917/g.44033  ORF Transcript_15917/g.44033 Transcript_15917/m.44033 type:complete len:107 (+) Transcript_15917:2724-3044(+)